MYWRCGYVVALPGLPPAAAAVRRAEALGEGSCSLPGAALGRDLGPGVEGGAAARLLFDRVGPGPQAEHFVVPVRPGAGVEGGAAMRLLFDR